MAEDSTLREHVRRALKEGRIPEKRPDKMWGGPGSGLACAICSEPLEPAEMAFDLEFQDVAGANQSVNRQLHIRCFAAWEFERKRTAASGQDLCLRAAVMQENMPASERNPLDPGRRE